MSVDLLPIDEGEKIFWEQAIVVIPIEGIVHHPLYEKLVSLETISCVHRFLQLLLLHPQTLQFPQRRTLSLLSDRFALLNEVWSQLLSDPLTENLGFLTGLPFGHGHLRGASASSSAILALVTPWGTTILSTDHLNI